VNHLAETPAYPGPEYPSNSLSAQHGEGGEGSTQANLLAIAWRSRWLILLSIVGGAAVSWVVLQQAVPRYTSTSRIYVERTLPKLLDTDISLAHSNNYLNTQAEIIRSTSVLAAVLERPEISQLDTLRKSKNPLGLLREQVTVEVGQNDDIINVSAELEDPDDAAQVVSAIVNAYIEKYVAEQETDLSEVLHILREEKVRRDAALNDVRNRIDAFRKEHVSLAVQVNDGNVVTQRFGMLAEELNSTQVQLLQAKARYDRAKQMYDSEVQRPFLLEAATANSVHLRDANLESQVRQTEQALTEELARWGAGYPAVKLLQTRLDDLKQRLEKQREGIIEGYVDSLAQEYQLLEHKRNELQRAYDEQFALATDVSAQATTLKALQEERQRAETACDLVDDRIREITLSKEAVGKEIVTVMEPAAKGYLTYPNRSKFLGMGVAFGGMLGFGLAWLRDLLDHRLRSIDEIADVMQLPVLGAIPLFTGEKSRQASGQLVALQPRSTAAEAVRTLRTGMHFSLGGDDVKILAVTSPSPGDGKSTVASNLAIAISQVEQRVLLIDADMRKPMQGEIFGIDSPVGLANVLAERCPPEEAILHKVCGNLDILPCGKLPANPVELLNNGYFVEMLQRLLMEYDKIVIDSPPVMPVADARVIAAVADSTLLVLRAEKATRRLSVAARDELWRVRAKRIGVAVNAVPARKQGYGYGGGYGYGAYGAYGGYGDVAYGYDDQELQRRNGQSNSTKEPRKQLTSSAPH
jgi:succinoglycan biosynthesis transport protein ExoP